MPTWSSRSPAHRPRHLGQYFKCSVNLYNAGWEVATNAVLTNWLPPGVQFISATSSRGTCTQAGGVVACALGDVPPYTTSTLTMEFKATTTGLCTNAASAFSDTPDPNPTNSQAEFATLVTPARFFAVGRMNTNHVFPSSTLLTNGSVLVVGWNRASKGELYNPATRTFGVTGDMAIRLRNKTRTSSKMAGCSWSVVTALRLSLRSPRPRFAIPLIPLASAASP